MPELPEVETIVRTLEKSLQGKRIENFNLRYPKLEEKGSELPLSNLEGMTFESFSRRGKYLCFGMREGWTWIIHLRMEGKFYLYDEAIRPTQHTHLTFNTEDVYVHYLDTRKFSRMALIKDPSVYFLKKNLGLEPWDDNLTGDYLYASFQKTERVIKNVLLDQSIVVGIGNIYADEILYEARIHPLTPANRVSKQKCRALVGQIRNILENAILAGGTTIRSYTYGLNLDGRFQVMLHAYGQANKPCGRCGKIMKRIVISGRSSVYCPQCQRVKK